MGMFDYLRCKYPLPIDGTQHLLYQTKSTPAQFLDHYEIREDGSLWHQEYDTVDKSRRGEWYQAHPGQEIPPMPRWRKWEPKIRRWFHLKYKDYNDLYAYDAWFGFLSRVNERWAPEPFTGEIRFYEAKDGDWIEWSAYFTNGQLDRINLVDQASPWR